MKGKYKAKTMEKEFLKSEIKLLCFFIYFTKLGQRNVE